MFPQMIDDWICENEESQAIDFFTASSLGLQDMVELYVGRDQNVNEQNEGGWTALMYACAYHKNSLVSYLLTKGAEVTHVDHFGKTFLTVAAENQNLNALRALNTEAVRSIINRQEYKYGFTPLMYSASQGDYEMAKALLSLGADTAVKDVNDRTAVELANLNGHKTTYWLLKYYGYFTIRDVLEEIDLDKYAYLFTNITTDELLLLDDNGLKELGMKLLGPRKKLILTIEKIKEIKKGVMNYPLYKM